MAQGNVIAENYVVDFGILGTSPTYAAVDAAFNATTKTRVAIAGASQTIAAVDFNLIGLDLTTAKTRTVIVANIENEVKSYQIFRISFNKPLKN